LSTSPISQDKDIISVNFSSSNNEFPSAIYITQNVLICNFH